MAYSRAPVTINLTDTIEEMRVEVNALSAKLNELFDGSNNFVTGGASKPALITSPVLAGSITGTYTLAGTPTFTNPTINAATLAGTVASTATVTGTLNLTGTVLAGASPLVFEAGTDNAYELILAVADIASSDKTITLPDATGTVSLIANAERLSNKELLGSSEDVAGDGSGTYAVSVSKMITNLSTSGGTSALTLGTGTDGQIKIIIMEVAGNAATMTASNGNLQVSTSIVWDAVGEAVILVYSATLSKWVVVSAQGATVS